MIISRVAADAHGIGNHWHVQHVKHILHCNRDTILPVTQIHTCFAKLLSVLHNFQFRLANNSAYFVEMKTTSQLWALFLFYCWKHCWGACHRMSVMKCEGPARVGWAAVMWSFCTFCASCECTVEWGAHGPREEQAREPAHPTAHICNKRDEVPLHPHAQGCLNFLAVVVPALHSHIVQRYPVVCQM